MSDLYIALLNPAIALILATVFLLLWLTQRRRRHLAALAAGYAASASGFLLQHFNLPIGIEATRLASTAAFLICGGLITGAVVARFRGRAPFASLAGFGIAGLAAFAWFMFVSPDLTWRVYSTNFALGAMTLLVAAELRPVAARSLVERSLVILAILAGLNLIVRPLATIMIHAPQEGPEAFHQSLYWTTAILSHALLSLLIALVLIASAGLDIIHDLRAETHTDPLSGLFNRRGFELRAEALLERSARAGLPVTLVIADLDQFKSLNDRYGHSAGDRVIIEFADRLSMAAGGRGIAGRLGGEEFGVLLPFSDIAAARQLAEAVRAAFSAAPVDGLPPQFRATASFGVASRSADESYAELFSRADEALYRAKKSGRDGVRSSYQRPAEGVQPVTLLQSQLPA